ncbi:hypothetical protein ABZX93_33410 [Streptomyces sp. NPDC006632]|uniref:hypothetical protein n=1 Tax=Streptomyces sp. NPDC006632 TaxID=3157182 RepID=UPI0033A5D4EB
MTAALADTTDWFLAAHPHPGRLADEWAVHPRWTAQLLAGRAWDAVAMPYSFGCNVLDVCETLQGYRPAALADGPNRRLYLFVEPGRGGIWDDEVWTLPGETWLTVPHPQYRPYDCWARWLQPPGPATELMTVAELRRAISLATPASRRHPTVLSVSVEGGVL